MILLVWLVAFVVSLAPILGWKDPQFYVRLEVERKCLISQDVGYQIFATCATFYVPLFVILLLYWKIFQTARRRIRRRPGRLPHDKSKEKKLILPEDGSSRMGDGPSSTPQLLQLQTPSRGGISRDTTADDLSNNPSPTDHRRKSETIESIVDAEIAGVDIERDDSTAEAGMEPEVENSLGEAEPCNGRKVEKTIALATLSPAALLTPAAAAFSSPARVLQLPAPRKRTKESIEAKRERKAAKTLAIITGAFVVCWLPFFVMALTLAVCSSCWLPIQAESAFLWLGYFNSTLNPIIYTLFSPEFRQAFKRLLCGRKRYRRK
jgi:5-hydroxytryptamine receptor 1